MLKKLISTLFSERKTNDNYIYVCNNNDEEDHVYNPKNDCLQDIARRLQKVAIDKRPWPTYFEEGLNHLQVISPWIENCEMSRV